ncbi:hypothetical protein [Nocardiopsis sp. LOL_012]|uniref:hypothetical protein n=1 Tax=Nocardiopsis sp. LOL_012 TaxID=3345409 RepID=UPI003A86107E
MRLFQECPELAPRLLSEHLGVEVPVYDQAVLQCADPGEAVPVERRADAVVALLDSAVNAVLEDHGHTRMVIVEVQNEYREYKFRRWAHDAGSVADVHACEAAVLAVCPKQSTADRFDADLRVGPRHLFRSLVLGPGRLSAFTDPREVTRSPLMAILDATADPQAPGALKALLEGFASLDEATAADYTQYTLTLLDEDSRRRVEEIMATDTYRYSSAFTERYVQEGVEQGLLEGEARVLLKVLDRRGVVLSEAERRRISECADADPRELFA